MADGRSDITSSDDELDYFCPVCGRSAATKGACSKDGTTVASKSRIGVLGHRIGSYTVVAKLGAGGMGEVYRAIQPQIGARVAIKILRGAAGDPRALVEAQAVNRVQSDHIIKVLDAGTFEEEVPYLVMELLDGLSLAELLHHHGPLDVATAARILDDVLEGLGAAHAEDIVHRDLKPANIFITRSGRVVVLDFGIAKLLDSTQPKLTRTGAAVGTPAYMAPEQIRGESVDARTDVYAIGIMLFELLTGARPFADAVTFELMARQLDTPPPALRTVRAELPVDVETLVAKALAKRPEDRFASAAEMRAALRAVAGTAAPADLEQLVATHAPQRDSTPVVTTTVAASPQGTLAESRVRSGSDPAATRVERPASRPKPARWPLVLAAAALAGGGAGYLLLQRRSHEAPVHETRLADANVSDAAADATAVVPAPADAAVADAGRDASTDAGHRSQQRDANVQPTLGEPIELAAPPKVDAFDVIRYIPTALVHARKMAADAQLEAINIPFLRPDGTARLQEGSMTVQYRFLSKSHPETELFVQVRSDKVRVVHLEMGHMSSRPTRAPHCSLLWLYEAALAQAGGAFKIPPSFDWFNAEWTVSIGSSTFTLSETCDQGSASSDGNSRM